MGVGDGVVLLPLSFPRALSVASPSQSTLRCDDSLRDRILVRFVRAA
jgi:hypothetical protein